MIAKKKVTIGMIPEFSYLPPSAITLVLLTIKKKFSEMN